jgi:hypothetical protein
MNIEIKELFMEAWKKYFPDCELPIASFYSNELNNVEFPNAPKPNTKGFTCIFSQIAPVRKGRARAFNMKNLGCFGSFLPFGFTTEITEDVIAPFGTGCDSIIGYPMHELTSEQPKAVLGPLDPLVRVNFKPDTSTFAAPWPKFLSMLNNIDESFLTTDSWANIKVRFSKVK